MAGAAGPVVMGRVFDLTGSYISLLAVLAAQTLAAGLLSLLLPRYPHDFVTSEEPAHLEA
jgi:hypothetical protein